MKRVFWVCPREMNAEELEILKDYLWDNDIEIVHHKTGVVTYEELAAKVPANIDVCVLKCNPIICKKFSEYTSKPVLMWRFQYDIESTRNIFAGYRVFKKGEYIYDV